MDKKNWLIIGLVLLVVVVEVFLTVRRKRKITEVSDKITKLLVDKKFKEFYELIASNEVKKVIPPFNIDYLKMSAAFLQNDDNKIVESLEKFDKVNLNKAQKKQVYLNGFMYYIDKENKEKTLYYKNKCEEVYPTAVEREKFDNLYSIKIEKSYEMLDEMLEKLPSMEGEAKRETLYLIAMMYENKGEPEKADEYYNQMKEFMN